MSLKDKLDTFKELVLEQKTVLESLRKMNYEETQDQIRRSLDGRVQGIELTVTEFEFYE